MNLKKILFFLLFVIFLYQQDLYAQVKIEISDAGSLARVGMKIRPKIDDEKTALTFYNALSNNDRDSLRFVEKYYFELSRKDTTPGIKIYSSLCWLSKCINADKKDLDKELEDPLFEDLFYYFTENDFERLKEFLKIKYNLFNYNTLNKNITNKAFFFYNDFLMLNAPDREIWDSTSKIMSFLPLKKGDKVVDLGCGTGYYTFRLSDIVGDEGKVFATDIESDYIEHLKNIVKKTHRNNILPILTFYNDIGVHDSVDAVFISKLYHDFYVMSSDDDRAELFYSMKQDLKINGYLIIIDNLSANGREMNTCFVDKKLVIAQLAFWGFSYVDYKEFSNQSYALILKNTGDKVKEQIVSTDEKIHDKSFLLNVDSEKSIFHIDIGLLSFKNFTQRGKEAARLALNFFETGNTESVRKAIEIYKDIIPLENFGGEYEAIQWLCEVKSCSDEKRKLILKEDLLSDDFYNVMTDNNDSLIKFYLINKYKLYEKKTHDSLDSLAGKSAECYMWKLRLIENYILNLNPKRENWEKSSRIIENLNLQKGQVIANLGSGPGYFSYKFSKIVGIEGKVYNIEFEPFYIKTLQNFIIKQNIKNIEVIKGEINSFNLSEKADFIFMCSFYHNLYGLYAENDREGLIKKITESLKTNGKLVIVDNGPVGDGILPYNGSFISKKLIEYQLAFYGFELVSDVQIIPQRYMLTFKLKEN